MRQRLFIAAALFGLWSAPAQAQAQAPSDVMPTDIMIVLDSSGSMWGQIDGTSKRDIARTALKDLLEDLPSGARTGLIAYGHRKKGDCSDIETLAAPGSGANLSAKVDAIRPKGKTPLTAAVRQAAEQLKITENTATVIAITDGIETCDADPCAAGAELEALGVDFTAHVVGFGLSEAEGRQVACLAEETGGLYLQASDAGSLAKALETVAEATEAPPVEVGTAQAKLIVPAQVEIGAAFEITYEGPNDDDQRPDYVDLVTPDATGTAVKALSYFYVRNGNPGKMRAPGKPGAYLARYIWSNPKRKQVIAEAFVNVVDAQVALSAPQSVGVGQSFEVDWKGPANENDYIDIVPRGYTKTTGEISYQWLRNTKGGPAVITAPREPGEHDLRYITIAGDGRRVLKTLPITVEDVRTEIAFAPEIELGQVLDVDWTGPGARNDYIDIVPAGQDSTSDELTYRWTRQGNPAQLQLPGEPGDYEVRYILYGPKGKRIMARAPLSLKGVDVTMDFTPSIPMGQKLDVAWQGPGGQNDYIDLVPRGYTPTTKEISYRWLRQGNPATLMLPIKPGEYDIRYILYPPDGKRVLLTKPLTVTPVGATLDAPQTLAQDKVLEVAWTGPNADNDYIDIAPAGSQKASGEFSYTYTNRGDVVTLALPADPGPYALRYIHRGAGGKKRVLKSQPITITEVGATLEAPATAAAGSRIEVSWTGPGMRNDYIDIVPRGQKRTKDELAYFYTRSGPTGMLKMPTKPGAYDIRYVMRGAKKRVVKAVVAIEVE